MNSEKIRFEYYSENFELDAIDTVAVVSAEKISVFDKQPSFVLGYFPYKTKIVPVVDMTLFLQLKALEIRKIDKEFSHFVVLHSGEHLFAIAVTSMICKECEVHKISRDDIEKFILKVSSNIVSFNDKISPNRSGDR